MSDLYEAYNEIYPVYDRVTNAVTFGLANRWRRLALTYGLSMANGALLRVLDAGSGMGSMSRELLSMVYVRHIVLLDQSLNMLKRAIRGVNIDVVCGSFEKAPFRDLSFNMVLMGFSLHASTNVEEASCEVGRVLKPGGILASVNIGKPDNPVLRALGWLYTAVAIPLITLFTGGPRYVKYFYGIHEIYVRLKVNRMFKDMVAKCLKVAAFKTKALGMVNILVAVKGNGPSPSDDEG